MRRTGVDLTSTEGLRQTIDVFARLVDDLERNIALTAV
jgi:oligoendopeptidase F